MSYRDATIQAAVERCHFLASGQQTNHSDCFRAAATRSLSQPDAHVRSAYRTPTQLGLLERFHQTLKTEEVYTYDKVLPA
jgi:hypothetical protein